MATKYLIFSVIFFGYAMFAYNRKGVSFAIPKLLEEGLENNQVGLILSSQNLAYAISKFLGGIISDRLSPRILFSSGLFISGLAAVLFSVVDSVPLFTVVWFLNGLAQGVGWPAIAKLLKSWFEPDELGTWWSMASASANLSGCVAPFMAAYIILNYGWRFSLLFVGGVTLVAALIAYIFIVDSPTTKSISTAPRSPKKESKSTNEDKKKKSPKEKSSKESPKGAFRLLIGSQFVIVVSILYMFASFIKTSVTDWSQMYLMLDCHQSSLVANSFVSCVEFGGFFGGIAAGYLSDLYVKNNLNGGGHLPKHGHPRMLVALAFAMISCISLYLFHYNVTKSTHPVFINQLGVLIGVSIYGQIAIYGVVATSSVPDEISGTSHAIAALAANIGSVIAGLPLAAVAKQHSWSYVFNIQFILALATIIFMMVKRNIPYKVRTQSDFEKKSK